MKSPLSPGQRAPVLAGVIAALLPSLTLLPIELCAAAAGLIWLGGAVLVVFAFFDYNAPPSTHPDREPIHHDHHFV